MTYQQDKQLRRLLDLIHLDMDAVLAYEQAILHLSDTEIEIIGALERFQKDHLRHIEELSIVVEQLGGEAPEFKRDAKGFLIEGMTAVMSRLGTRATLLAMTENEMLINVKYQLAIEADLDSKILALVHRNRADEQQHLTYITKALKDSFALSRAPASVETASPH